MSVPHSADIFQTKPESLATLLPEIQQHKTALPNFQREWVWEIQMVADLIVSVANRYPAGSLLTMPNTGRTFALRPFTGSGDELTNTPSLMVLDGQQRLTSLYQALYSKDGVRDRTGKTFHLYLDVKHLTSFNSDTFQTESTFAQSLIVVQERANGERIYYRGLRDFDDVSTTEQEIKLGYMPLNTVFDPPALDAWRDEYMHTNSDKNYDKFFELRQKWDAEVAPWIQQIREYRFPVIELNKDMELAAICHIFEKVNSTGVPLTVFELCTAILWAQGLQLNKKWEETKDFLKQNQILRMQGDLDGTTFLQVISLLATLERKQQSPEARIAVSMRREALLRLDADTVNKWWDTALQGYQDASRFLLQQGVIARRILPYTTMLVPLAAMMANFRSKLGAVEFGSSWPKIERWYWCAVFGNRYSGPSETVSAIDLEQMVNWIDGGDEPDVIRTFTFSADRLLDISTIRNVVYKGVLCLLTKNGAKDFSGEGLLSTQLFYEMHQDHHHIFPRAALDRLGVESKQRECIINKTLIGAAANRSIGGRRPSAYLATLRERLGTERMDEILRSHLIDPASLATDDWEQFILLRREAIKSLIETTCGKTVIDFSDGQQASLPARIQRVTDSVRDVELEIRGLIAERLGDDWTKIPDHTRVRIEDRITRAMAENPGLSFDETNGIRDRLSYADLRELESIIVAKQSWSHFSDVFGTKEMLSNRFRQISPLRNASAHHREITELEKMDAEAANIWFESALTAIHREKEVGVDNEEEDAEDASEDIDLVPVGD